MTITTKFNINDEVWFIHPRTQLAVNGKVSGIEYIENAIKEYKISQSSRELLPTGEYEISTRLIYMIGDNEGKGRVTKFEKELFPTKQELINSL